MEQNADPDLHQSLYYGDAPAIQNCVWGYYAQSNARGATAKELPRCWMQSEQMLVVLQQARTVNVGTVDKTMLEEQLPLRAIMELTANETMLQVQLDDLSW